jgi:hypothetical protein
VWNLCSRSSENKPKYKDTQKLQGCCSKDIVKDIFAEWCFLSVLPSQSTPHCAGTSHKMCMMFTRLRPQLPFLSDILFTDEP